MKPSLHTRHSTAVSSQRRRKGGFDIAIGGTKRKRGRIERERGGGRRETCQRYVLGCGGSREKEEEEEERRRKGAVGRRETGRGAIWGVYLSLLFLPLP